MRTLKFRLWDGENYWYWLLGQKYVFQKDVSKNIEVLVLFEKYGASENWEQFTGKLDKDTTPIYENDIIGDYRRKGQARRNTMVAVGEELNLMVFPTSTKGIHSYCMQLNKAYSSEIKVIGNFNENKELIIES